MIYCGVNGNETRTEHDHVSLLLFVRLHTLVQLDDVAADEPHQVGEVGHGRFVPDVVQHVLVIHCRARGDVSTVR